MSICSDSAGKFGWVDGFAHVHVFVCNTVCILCVAYTYVHAMSTLLTLCVPITCKHADVTLVW